VVLVKTSSGAYFNFDLYFQYLLSDLGKIRLCYVMLCYAFLAKDIKNEYVDFK